MGENKVFLIELNVSWFSVLNLTVCLSVWMDPPAKENKTLKDLCDVCSLKSEKKLLPDVGGAVRLMQD